MDTNNVEGDCQCVNAIRFILLMARTATGTRATPANIVTLYGTGHLVKGANGGKTIIPSRMSVMFGWRGKHG